MNVGGVDLKIALSQLEHRERETHGENVQRHIRVPCFDVFVPVVGHHKSSELYQSGYYHVF